MHDYDMYGHTPGCPQCHKEQEEINQRDRNMWAERETIKHTASVTVTYDVVTDNGQHTITKTFLYRPGDKLTATTYLLLGQRAAYEIQKFING